MAKKPFNLSLIKSPNDRSLFVGTSWMKHMWSTVFSLCVLCHFLSARNSLSHAWMFLIMAVQPLSAWRSKSLFFWQWCTQQHGSDHFSCRTFFRAWETRPCKMPDQWPHWQKVQSHWSTVVWLSSIPCESLSLPWQKSFSSAKSNESLSESLRMTLSPPFFALKEPLLASVPPPLSGFIVVTSSLNELFDVRLLATEDLSVWDVLDKTGCFGLSLGAHFFVGVISGEPIMTFLEWLLFAKFLSGERGLSLEVSFFHLLACFFSSPSMLDWVLKLSAWLLLRFSFSCCSMGSQWWTLHDAPSGGFVSIFRAFLSWLLSVTSQHNAPPPLGTPSTVLRPHLRQVRIDTMFGFFLLAIIALTFLSHNPHALHFLPLLKGPWHQHHNPQRCLPLLPPPSASVLIHLPLWLLVSVHATLFLLAFFIFHILLLMVIFSIPLVRVLLHLTRQLGTIGVIVPVIIARSKWVVLIKQSNDFITMTDKLTPAQLFACRGDWLFTETMTDRVCLLARNCRVQYEKFKALPERLRRSRATQDDSDKSMKLHHVFCRHNPDFKHNTENHDKTMWLFSNNADTRKRMSTSLLKPPSQTKCPQEGSTAGMAQARHKTENKSVHACRILTQAVTNVKQTRVSEQGLPWGTGTSSHVQVCEVDQLAQSLKLSARMI